MLAALAAVPLVAVVIAMAAGLRAAVAGALGLGLALALLPLGFDLTAGGVLPPALAIGGPLAEALSSAAVILWIILPALVIYELQDRAGALYRIRDALAALTPDRSLQVMLIAWFFGLFMEGAAGFGASVALAAPLLVGLGLPPVRAVAVALLGHAPGVSFGAIGTPVLVQVEATGLPPVAIATATAALHAPLLAGFALVVMRLSTGARLSRAQVLWSLAAAACFALPTLAFAALAGPELATLGGALIGGSVFAVLLRRRGGASLAVPGLLRDLAPYLIIVALVLATRLIDPLQAALTDLSLSWELHGGFRGGFLPLYHAGTLLMLGVVAGALVTGRAALIVPAFVAAMRRLWPVALALVVMLALARVMVHAGMIGALADAATGAGHFWPLFAPLIGVLGSFVTGSATASNILFTPLQAETAAALGLAPVAMAAAQGLGAAIGNAVAPHNIIAGAATVGLTGREGLVLRLTALPVVGYALGAGLILWLWIG